MYILLLLLLLLLFIYFVGPSIDDLLLNTMSGLSDAKGKRPVTKSDFKTSSSMKNSPVPVSKTFATSSKAAKVWGEGRDDFSGLFSIEQDTPTPPPPPLATHPPPAMSPSSDDDGFGEFQSVSSITERGGGGGGGVRGGTVQPLTMTSPPSASPVLVHYQSGGPPVMATSSHQAPSLPSWLLSPSQQLPQLYNDVYQVQLFIVYDNDLSLSLPSIEVLHRRYPFNKY